MRLKLQGDPTVLHWIDADKLETLDSESVKLHFTCPAAPVCRMLSAIPKASRAPCLSISLGGQPGHLGYHLLRARRARRAQRATLGVAGDAQGPRPPPPLLLLPPRAGCGHDDDDDRRRGPAARGPSHAAILTRAASPPSPVRDFRNQKAISLSPGKGTMLGRGREP